jgi:dihydropteroate synthase
MLWRQKRVEQKMSARMRRETRWQLRSRALELGRRTLVMGVVNVTPDSFSDGGHFLEPTDAVAHALRLLDEGADLLDVGAESTRPGSRAGFGAAGADGAEQAPAVSAAEEQARLLPVIRGILAERPGTIVSADTYKAQTARAALDCGAEIVNDVSGFSWDSELAGVCAEADCGVVLMHTRGRPDEWAGEARLYPDAVIAAVRDGLQTSLDKAAAAGIAEQRIVLDPGYGFGKHGEENFALLARQAELLALGWPLLAGVSRKSFLGQALAPLHAGKTGPVEAREIAGVSAMVSAILNGASLVRVHRVRQAVEAALVADAVLAQMTNCR